MFDDYKSVWALGFYWICVVCDFVVCITLITVDCRDRMTSAVHLIPKLWPFLSHSIRSVRRAALRTMSVLLATGRLKVSERLNLDNS